MVRKRASRSRLPLTVAATAAAVLVAGLASTSNAGAAPSSKKLAPGISTATHGLGKSAKHVKAATLPSALPKSGKYAFLLKLATKSTLSAHDGAKAKGKSAARSAAKSQLSTIKSAQTKVVGQLPAKTHVLYRTHAVMSGVAVLTDVRNLSKLKGINGVSAVYPIAVKRATNSYAVPFQGAPKAWKAYGDLGAGTTIAIIDTGIDYTHANFGGPGTVPAYQAALATDTVPADPASYNHAKFDATTLDQNGDPAHFFDFAGDAYDPADPANSTPQPDPNPLDCDSHGSHVAGTAAGLGENADGSTYSGAYNKKTPFDTMRIGPGMAPAAQLWPFKVFGCAGSTNVVGEAIDKAMDPNGDGDTSDHADVVNMSLGSDYTSPQDGDSVLTNDASAAGVTVVTSSGNGGDLYDIGGSPGDAVTALTAANSVDAYAQDDSLVVSAPSDIAGPYAALRAQAYDWANQPDLQGDVVALTDPTNPDGCKPLSADDQAVVAGKIVFEEWTDDDYSRACGSVARGAILEDTDAAGFIFADDRNGFSAGITGSEIVPGVLVAKDGADAIREQLQAGATVTVSGTGAGDFKQLDESQNDQLDAGSSRGIGGAGNVKPDVAAVGTSVFSTGMGTGNEGLNDSGTSMSSPMVAGTAALVRSHNPAWTPEQVKADIMNTADADLYTGANHTGKKYGPNRVGAGRIDVKRAIDNQTLAYVTDDPGAVSASFGPLALTSAQTFTKTIKVQNTSLTSASYDVSFKDRSTIPGATYSVSPSSISVDPRSSKRVTLTLSVDPSQLTKTIDPTVHRTQKGLPRQYVADASGLVMFKGDGVPNLRVPAYAAPRPASNMTQASSLTLPRGAVQTSFLPLTGQRVNQGSGAEAIQSTVAGFELQATSGVAPACSATVLSGCVNFPDEKSADLKYVGITSDAPQLNSIGEDPLESPNGLAYFALATHGPWRNVSNPQTYEIFIDGDGDGVSDAVLLNTNLPAATLGTDVMISELIDLNSGDVLDIEALNDSLGDTDTAMFDSDTIVLPVAIGAIPGVSESHSRINYAVQAYSGYQNDPVDTVGDVDDNSGEITNGLSFDVLHPGLAVYGSYNGDTSALLYADSPGSVLQVRRDAAAYARDKGKGALLVHFHNKVGAKAQVASLTKSRTKTSLTMSPNPAQAGRKLSGTVTVSNTAGAVPRGTAVLKRTTGPNAPVIVASGSLVNGKVVLSFTPRWAGTYKYKAIYKGDGVYSSARSAAVSVKIRN